jgi:hypothetical protein
MKRSAIRRLARAVGLDEHVVASAIYRGRLDELVDERFAESDQATEDRVADAWGARLGVGPSQLPKPRRAYADAEEELHAVSLARLGLEPEEA